MSNIKYPITFTSGGADRGKGKRLTKPLLSFYKGGIEKPWQDPDPWSVYLKSDQDTRSKKKAMPGWFKAATDTDNKRSVRLIEKIHAVQLDIDYATPDKETELRENLTPLGGTLHIVHTTRSHTPEAPRMRVLIPLSRGVSPDEAHAIARIVSQRLDEDPQEGLDFCDPVSFRNNQIAYWPSISKGQPYWSELHDGDVLVADEVLAEVDDWTNLAHLPMQSQEDDLRPVDAGKTLGDPREKPGYMGAFCRTFNIEEAAEEFFPDAYEPGNPGPGEYDRWTYSAGTSSNGMVIYEYEDAGPMYGYSHQSSDPAAEKACNPFDLTRIQVHGHLDEKAKPGTPVNKLPSHAAMIEMCQTLPEVQAEMVRGVQDKFEDFEDDDDEHVEETSETEHDDDHEFDFGLDDDTSDDDEDIEDWDPFGEIDFAPSRQAKRQAERKSKKRKTERKAARKAEREADEEFDKKKEVPWEAKLRVNKYGKIESNIYNSTILSENAKGVAERLGFNEHTRMPVVFKPIGQPGIPSASPPVDSKKGWREVMDADDHSVAIIFSAPKSVGGYEVDFSKIDILRGMAIAGRQKSFHPVKDKIEEYYRRYVESGRATKGEIYRMPQRWLGCSDTPMHKESSYALLLGMIARIYEPGCKYDIVVILRGKQGARKSTFWETLSMGFFSNLGKNFSDIGRMIEAMQGSWVSEMAEMSGFRRETVNEAKDFITRGTDKFRLAYGTRTEEYPRQGVLVSTTNEHEVLHDPTGNRRFIIWITEADEENPIDLEGFAEAVPMLIGEAYDEYLRLRKADPHKPLWLDVRSPEARKERDKLADAARAKTAAENLSDVVREHLDWKVPVEQVLMGRGEGDEITDPRITDLPDGTLILRNAVRARDVFGELVDTPDLRQFRDATVNLMGRAIDSLDEWQKHDKVRVNGLSATAWYSRVDGPGVNAGEWIPAPEEPEDDIDLDDLG